MKIKPLKLKTDMEVTMNKLLLVCLWYGLTLAAAPAAPLGTAFNFSGRLIYQNQPANGDFDLKVALFDDPTAGSQVGLTLNLNGLSIVSGLFITNMDFGNVFDVPPRPIAIVLIECYRNGILVFPDEDSCTLKLDLRA